MRFYCRSSRRMARSRAKILVSAARRFRFRRNRPRCCRWRYTSLPQMPLSMALYLRRERPYSRSHGRYRGNEKSFDLRWREGAGEAQLLTSRSGGASAPKLSRNRYHICCTGNSSERSVPMEWNAPSRFFWTRLINEQRAFIQTARVACSTRITIRLQAAGAPPPQRDRRGLFKRLL